MSPEQQALVEAVARRVVELLREAPVADRPLTVREVAVLLGRSPDYVREHRSELGVLPATGKRPRLLFDVAKVRAAISAPTAEAPAAPPQATRRRRSRQVAPNLLPIAGKRC